MCLRIPINFELLAGNNPVTVKPEKVPLLCNIVGKGGSILRGLVEVQATTQNVIREPCWLCIRMGSRFGTRASCAPAGLGFASP